MIARIKQWAREILTNNDYNTEELNQEFSLNHFALPNPIISDLDLGGFLFENFDSKQVFKIQGGSSFADIRSVIDDVPDGGIIFFGKGTFEVGVLPIELPANVWVIGSGSGTIFQKQKFLLNDAITFPPNEPTSLRGGPIFTLGKNARVMNCIVDMNGLTGANYAISGGSTAAIYSSQEGAVVENVEVRNHGSYEPAEARAEFAIDLEGDNSRISFCKIVDGATGAISLSGTSSVVEGNYIRRVAGRGIQVTQMQQCEVHGNIIRECGKEGIYFSDSSISGVSQIRIVHFSVSTNILEDTMQFPDSGSPRISRGGAITGSVVGLTSLHGVQIDTNIIRRVGGTNQSLGFGILFEISGSSSDSADGILNSLKIQNNQIQYVHAGGIVILAVQLTLGSVPLAQIEDVLLDGNMILDVNQGEYEPQSVSVAVTTSTRTMPLGCGISLFDYQSAAGKAGIGTVLITSNFVSSVDFDLFGILYEFDVSAAATSPDLTESSKVFIDGNYVEGSVVNDYENTRIFLLPLGTSSATGVNAENA